MKRLYIYIMYAVATMAALAQNHNFNTAKQLEIFNALYRTLDLQYVDSLDAKKNIGTAIEQMLLQVDPYTVYYAKESTEDLKVLSTGKYAGIGSPIHYRTDLDCAIFSDPYQDMPAYKSGIRSGDRIRKIDGVVVSGEKPANTQDYLSGITNRLRGEPATQVVVEVDRLTGKTGATDSLEHHVITITRQQIQRPNILISKMLTNSIGYINLQGYTEGAATQLRTAIQALKSQGMQSLIFDLRGNGGGLLQEAVDMVGLFVKRGTEVVSMRGRTESSKEEYFTSTEPLDRKMPIVVLTDYGTASAAEITAGALQDIDRAVVIGQRSYGKGLVQRSASLPYGGALKYTVAKYYIPSGRCIQALDYSKRSESGQPTHMPDSLCKTFYTKAGRPVKDGGGITPDVVVKNDTLPSLIGYLRLSAQFSDWTTRYCNSHERPASVVEVKITDAELDDLRDYLKANQFKYDNLSKRKLTELREWARMEGYTDEAAPLFDQLETTLAHNIDHDFMRWRKELRETVESEIAANFFGEIGAFEYFTKEDPVLKEALSILSDQQRYLKILSKP